MLDVKTVSRAQNVVSAIATAVAIESKAGKAYHDVAKLAAASLPKDGSPIDLVAAFRAIYKAELAQLSAHGSMMIRENLLLILAPETAVSIESTENKQKVEKHTTAAAVVGGTKDAVQQAAQQVRESLGAARAEGGGRKPAQPATIPTQVTDTSNDPDLAFAAFLHNLPVYFNDPAKALKITATLKEMGFKLQIIK
jgi:hypothetical protein